VIPGDRFPRTRALRIVGTMPRKPYFTNLQSPVYFWDPLAAVAATDQQAVQLQAARLVISTEPGADLGITRIGPAGSPVRLAMSANQSVFHREFLTTLNGGQQVPIPAAPASRQLAVSYDGRGYAYLGPHAADAGPAAIRLANTSSAPFDGFSLIIGKLAVGRTLSDVQAVIRASAAPSVPPWFQVTAILPAASGANPAWGLALTPGRYALVCVLLRERAVRAHGADDRLARLLADVGRRRRGHAVGSDMEVSDDDGQGYDQDISLTGSSSSPLVALALAWITIRGTR
jgi:hypothetical protein